MSSFEIPAGQSKASPEAHMLRLKRATLKRQTSELKNPKQIPEEAVFAL